MIEKVQLPTIPFGNSSIGPFRRVNYLYGPNGSGKTSISRAIDADSGAVEKRISWSQGTALETFVFSRDFIEQSFWQTEGAKGVFTMGEESVAAQREIDETLQAIDGFEKKLAKLMGTLGDGDSTAAKSKRGELAQAWNKFREACWKEKDSVSDDLKKHAFSGTLNNKDKFAGKVLESAKDESVKHQTAEELYATASVVLNAGVVPMREYTPVDCAKLVNLEASKLPRKPIVGVGNSTVAALIDQLKMSDWVHLGRAHFGKLKFEQCPFCQQAVPKQLNDELEKFFGGVYEKELAEFAQYEADYAAQSRSTLDAFEVLAGEADEFLDLEVFSAHKRTLETTLSDNCSRLEDKCREPSSRVDLRSDCMTTSVRLCRTRL